jgi:hypothetical protein
MVRDAIRNAMPMARKKPDRPHWKLKPVILFIEDTLTADRAAPRKVPGCEVSERAVRKYVRKRKLTLHLPTIGFQFMGLKAEAVKAKQSHVEYLEALWPPNLKNANAERSSGAP